MSWSVQRDKRLIANRDPVVVVNGPPFDRIALVLFRPGKLGKPRVRIGATEGHGTGRMVGMSVRHEDIAELSPMAFERRAKFLKVARLTDTGINQYR